MQNHFRLCYDLVALYIINPELFDINIITDKLNIRYKIDYDVQGVREAMTDMINGNYKIWINGRGALEAYSS